MRRVFLTGGSGFIGRRLIDALRGRGVSLVLLDRSGALAPLGTQPGIEVVAGDVLEPERYAVALSAADAVVHLAAATGKASAQEHMRTNAAGTEALLEQCRSRGVERFLFVSSIAAKFPDTRDYPYAQAKRRAEAAVRASGLRWVILRPTMVLGPGSPILTALEKLAGLPMLPIFGDGTTPVQPIHVDDLVAFITAVLEEDRFERETLELGGARQLTIEELVQEIRQARRGARGRPVHLPLAAILPALRVAESVGLGGVLPVTVGQLSTFRFDGTIESNPLHESRRGRLRDIREMLALKPAA